MNTIMLDGNSLTVENIRDFHRHAPKIGLSRESLDRIQASRDLVETWVREQRVMYGVTTGFGEFSNVSIDSEHLEDLQRNLIQSHSIGCGAPIPKDVTKTLMLLRANALAKGCSGIRIKTVEHLLTMLNEDVIPVIPQKGSVGSSGDLVPLSHLVLGMMGQGPWWDGDEIREHDLKDRLASLGLPPLRLSAKEGLALINGTQMMSAYLAHAILRARSLVKLADISGAMTLEALMGTDKACSPLLHAVRPHPGQLIVARNVLRLIEGSEIRASHRENDNRVQDSYSLRCIPQIHGASRDAIGYVDRVLGIEINAATDNPLIFSETKELIEGGNFHGQPLALAGDFLGIALSELANVSERRIERTVNGKLSGLPRFLTNQGGLHSGYMIAQYTAAALVSENKVLAHPASVDSIPTSANQEDHNSMGSIATRKAWEILGNLEIVLGIELMTASQALDFHHPLGAGRGTGAAREVVRSVIPFLEEDRVLHDDLRLVRTLVTEDRIVEAVQQAVGALE